MGVFSTHSKSTRILSETSELTNQIDVILGNLVVLTHHEIWLFNTLFIET